MMLFFFHFGENGRKEDSHIEDDASKGKTKNMIVHIFL